MTRILFFMILYNICTSVQIRQVHRCPSKLERNRIYRQSKCCSSLNLTFHCLFDDIGLLKETCNHPIQLPAGKYPRYSDYNDRIYYEPCPSNRYQPWPVKSNDITECEFLKSTCSGLGQVLCDEGSAVEDARCGCDYTNGYIPAGSSSCCSPLSTNCYCIFQPCKNETEELNKDYECIKKCPNGQKMLDGETECSDHKEETATIDETYIDYECLQICLDDRDQNNLFDVTNCRQRNSLSFRQPVSSFPNTTPFEIDIPGIHGMDNYDIRHEENVLYFFLVAAIASVFIVCCFLIKMHQKDYKTWKCLVPVVQMTIVVALCVFYWLNEKEDQMVRSHTIKGVIGIGVLIVCFIFSGSVAIVVLTRHSIVRRYHFYTEDYELKIFLLLKAAKNDDIKMLETLRQEKAVDMDDVDYDQRSALHVAACEGQFETVKYLIENNLCNPLATDRWNKTALDGAIFHQRHSEVSTERYTKVIKLLQNTNAPIPKSQHERSTDREHDEDDGRLTSNLNSRPHGLLKPHFREKKATELLNATKKGLRGELRRLKYNKTVMSVSNSSGRTAMHEAAENGMENIVEDLIKWHVSPFGWWSDKRPIDCISDKTSVIREKIKKYMEEFIEESGDTLESDVEESLQIVRLLYAASRGDVRSLKSYRKSGYNFLLSDYDSRTVLHIAVDAKQEHVVEFLLSDEQFRNQIKDKQDRWCNTPFMNAQENGGRIIYYKFLKYYKELIDTENDEYRTYQMLAAGTSGDVEQLERLHRRGVNMNLRDYDGRTALHLAAVESKIEAVKFLIQTARANPNIPDRDNRKPILETNNEEIKHLLKEEHSSEEEIVKVDSTLMEVMTLAFKGKLKETALKDERILYFSMDSCDYFKNTPLHVAASKARLDDVKFLLEHYKVSPFVRTSFWKTPLQLVEDKISYWRKKKDTSTIKEQIKLAKDRMEEFQKISTLFETTIESAINGDVKDDEHFKKYEPDARIFLFLNRAYRGDILAIRRLIQADETERKRSGQSGALLINQSDHDNRTALHLAAAEGHYELVYYLLQQEGIQKYPKDRWQMTPLDEARRNVDEEKDQDVAYQNSENQETASQKILDLLK